MPYNPCPTTTLFCVHSDIHRCGIGADTAASLVFDPSAGNDQQPDSEPGRQQARVDSGDRSRLAQRYECISHTLTSGAKIEQAVASRIRERPDLHTGFVAPALAMEREIAAIWENVLRIGRVGVHDRFQDLGGKSIHLVRIHSLIHERLKIPIEITMLFQHPTVASLAAHLSRDPGNESARAAQQRGTRMREARARAANRSGMVK